MQSLRSRLEERIQKKHLLSHPWYIRWQQGRLSRRELQGYAKEYFAFEREFPRFLSAIHSRCTDPNARRRLLENLMDEEAGEENHSELWLQFAEGLGLSRDEIFGHFHSDETEQLVRTFRKHCHSENIADGLAALYVFRRQLSEVARQKMNRWNWSEMTDDSAIRFFDVTKEAEDLAADTEISLLTSMCGDEEADERVVTIAEETLDALHEFLNGVERRYACLN
ncbi:MAG: CADD family putative folate metabolism protein [Deltaproteobacteria bacterium]|nr:CADD family putative folate metabolism protein [Deltaproteobacteria bacterium]